MIDDAGNTTGSSTGLEEADKRLVRTVDGLTDEEFAAPSLLPGWSRAHVVAHLALNAEGLGRALEGVTKGEPVPVYDSAESRDADVEELAGSASPAELRERLLAGVTRFADACGRMVPEVADVLVERIPGGPGWPAGTCADKRWVEVEVHHADLGAGYGPDDWPAEFAVHLLESLAARPPMWEPAFVADPDDVDHPVAMGTTDEQSPRVSGPVRRLAWWASGRGDSDGLTSTTGVLPEIGKW